MKKAIIISSVSLVTGVILVFVGYFVFTVIKTQQQVERNTATLGQVVNFLNSQIEKNLPADNNK